MKHKSIWLYTEFKADTKAIVLLAHGLNLDPTKMDELAHFFNSKKCDVLRIFSGSNPNEWEDHFEKDYEKASEQAEVLNLPLYFVGFSLGGLLGLCYMKKNPYHRFEKIALFAPAIHTNFYSKIPALLYKLFPTWSLPSLNLKNYRLNNKTSLHEYKKLSDLQKKYHPHHFELPTLLFFNLNDELVSTKNLLKHAGKNSTWNCIELTNSDSQLPIKYHHLMISEESIGHSMWQKVLKNLTAHFTL